MSPTRNKWPWLLVLAVPAIFHAGYRIAVVDFNGDLQRISAQATRIVVKLRFVDRSGAAALWPVELRERNEIDRLLGLVSFSSQWRGTMWGTTSSGPMMELYAGADLLATIEVCESTIRCPEVSESEIQLTRHSASCIAAYFEGLRARIPEGVRARSE